MDFGAGARKRPLGEPTRFAAAWLHEPGSEQTYALVLMSKNVRKLPRELDVPHPERLSCDHPNFDEIMLRHSISMALENPGYTDPETGYFVFNAKTLAEEGKCCANMCRHCPFKR